MENDRDPRDRGLPNIGYRLRQVERRVTEIESQMSNASRPAETPTEEIVHVQPNLDQR